MSQPNTWKGLAATLGVAEGTLHKWRKADSSPSSKSITAWKSWLKNRSDDSDDDRDWKTRDLRARALKREKELSLLNGELVEIVKVEAEWKRLIALAQNELRQMETTLPPKLLGQDASGIRQEIRAALDLVFERLSQPQTYAD